MPQRMHRYQLPYGNSNIPVAASADLIEGTLGQAIVDEAAALEEALASPIGTRPLRQIVSVGERVAIIVNDITRLTRTDMILPPILRTLNQAGIPDRDIFIVFALGIHKLQTDAERELIVGPEIARRIRLFDHVSTDDASLVEIGMTSFGNVVE